MAREMQMPLEHRTHAMLRDVVLGLGLSVFEAASSAMSCSRSHKLALSGILIVLRSIY